MKKLFLIVFTMLAIGCSFDSGSQPPTETIVTAEPNNTETPLPCPQATPEPLWVEPVDSPTDLLQQTIIVRGGKSEWVQVDTGHETYTASGDFDSSNNPAAIEIELLPGENHPLTVSSRVRVTEQGDCVYGGYTLQTTVDRYGDPLDILQVGGDQSDNSIDVVASFNQIQLEHLAKSKEDWETRNAEASGNYVYSSEFESWVGFGSETIIFVTNNVVTGRNYTSYDADKQPSDSFEEDADSIGSNPYGAPAKTIDELYETCEEILKTKHPGGNDINFKLFDDNLLNYCEYSDNACADDCAEGVRINAISFRE